VIKIQRLFWIQCVKEFSMFTNSKLQSAVRVALGAGVGAIALSAAPGVMAQDGAEELEEIVTTGSRIKRSDLDSASPVTVIEREAILAQGITDIGNLIQRMPSMSGTPIGTTTNNGGNGSVQIDLRGMGVNRTVTLINGQRTIDGGDYQTIPAIMIERVEILKDGASAIYGADAVSGVVNIITRTDFEGFNINLQTSDWFDSAGSQQSLGIIAGATTDRGHIMFGAEYIDQEEAFQGDTPWGFLQDSYYIYPTAIGGCEAHPTLPYDGTPAGGCYPIGSSRIPEGRLNFLTQGRFLVPSPGAVMVPHDGRTYNYAPVNYIQTPYERFNFFAEGAFEITDNVQFTGSLRTNSRRSDQELAPLPYDSNIFPSWEGVFNGTAVRGVSDENFYLRQAVDSYNAANGTALIYEPLSNVRRRMVEIPRHFSQNISQYNAILGLNGTFNDLDWDVFYNKGYRSRIDNDEGQFSGVRLQNSLGPSADLDGDGTPECYTDISDPATIIVGCVPMNMFGGEGTVTQAMLDYVAVELVDSTVSEQELAGFSLAGSAFDLPGGELGWAVGYQYWAQSLKFTPDSGKALGLVTGGTGLGTDGSLYNNGIFAEVYAPLFDNGTQSLALKGGVRYDDYNIFDGDTTWQFGVEFQALDSLKLRATAGTAFRAPTINELFDGLGRSAPTYTDPCDPNDFDSVAGIAIAPFCDRAAVRTDSQVTSFVGGNRELNPETADTFTAGVVWTPQFGDNDVSITLDWWSIELDDAISSFGVNFILDQCYVQGDATQCALITRRNDADYTISGIVDSQVNVASQTGEGVDLEVKYSFETEIGMFDADLLWAHMLEREKVERPGAASLDLLGQHTDVTAEDGGTYAEDKINASLHWSRGDFSAGYMLEYISGISADAPFAAYTQQVDSFLYHDLVFNYSFSAMGTTDLSLGVTNITDEAPPYIDAGFNGKTDPNTYRVFGMGYFFRLSHTFE
jgi:outer membrane receptor protein involved in Fe transport